jgi:exodeoxyribonuclease VII small subunit
MMADPAAGSDEPEVSFAAAIAELEAILADLEADDVDIDRLAAGVTRATELIALCRERITGVELEINHILDR